ncbi:MAG: hypothetical protein GY869_06105 [Planctomycetes bacterium]|nr:hypothetical protein [Planctomycetota bacterium]
MKNVKINEMSIGARPVYTFIDIAADQTIEAVFDCEGPFHVITALVGPGGLASPSGDVQVSEGDDKTFNIDAGPGYAIEDVKVDGMSMGIDPSYTFENVVSDHTIKATFIPDERNSSDSMPDIKANGSDGPIVVSSTEPVSITINLAPGYQAGANADCWIAAQNLNPDFEWFFYIHPAQWVARIARVIDLPLGLVDNGVVYSFNKVPAGDYIFYFGVDDNADGELDATWWDSVAVHVRE